MTAGMARMAWGEQNEPQHRMSHWLCVEVRSAHSKPCGLPDRILPVEAVAEAARAMYEVGSDNVVRYVYCFAAGTLIHTDQGPTPIEKIRVGMKVLSQPEDGGEQAYRPVINTVAHLDQPVYAVQVKVEGASSLTTLIATGTHPFWVEAPLVDEKHWMAAECLQPGFVLQLADGKKAVVHAAGLVRRTQHETIGFVADDRAGIGIVLDLSEGQIRLAGDDKIQTLGKLELGAPYLTPVYNFEVDEFHTYYVGEAAVWVHNSNCNMTGAITRTLDEASIPNARTCFPRETRVYTPGGPCEIEFVDVGSLVLSRCEKTGQQGFRRVLRTFEHECKAKETIMVFFLPEEGDGLEDAIEATPEHPFWVDGEGWVPAGELKVGQKLLIVDPIGQPDTDKCRAKDQRTACYVKSGKLIPAEITRTKKYDYRWSVFNIEVEEFHTYFAGSSGVWVHNDKPVKPLEIIGK